ncbi:unnamed protein product [Symbiodinium sp. CCMP2592]|nr:unnamed protein product [Symbiodinium sp. CCMP2592]
MPDRLEDLQTELRAQFGDFSGGVFLDGEGLVDLEDYNDWVLEPPALECLEVQLSVPKIEFLAMAVSRQADGQQSRPGPRLELLGHGGFGAVFRVDGMYALKVPGVLRGGKMVIPTDEQLTGLTPEEREYYRKYSLPMLQHELHLLGKLKHPNIVGLMDSVDVVCQSGGRFSGFVMELGLASLEMMRVKTNSKTFHAICGEALLGAHCSRVGQDPGIFGALKYLHAYHLRIHGDISPGNIVSMRWNPAEPQDMLLKLIDFGGTAVIEQETRKCGTKGYYDEKPGQSADTFMDFRALGKVVYKVLKESDFEMTQAICCLPAGRGKWAWISELETWQAEADWADITQVFLPGTRVRCQDGSTLFSQLPGLLGGFKDVVLAAVKRCGREIWKASRRLRNDKEVVLAAVRQNGQALQYVGTELRNEREVVLAAVRQDRRALQYAGEELRNDKEVVLAAAMHLPDASRPYGPALAACDLALAQRRRPTNRAAGNECQLLLLIYMATWLIHHGASFIFIHFRQISPGMAGAVAGAAGLSSQGSPAVLRRLELKPSGCELCEISGIL